jgi:hypothetical protein
VLLELGLWGALWLRGFTPIGVVDVVGGGGGGEGGGGEGGGGADSLAEELIIAAGGGADSVGMVLQNEMNCWNLGNSTSSNEPV